METKSIKYTTASNSVSVPSVQTGVIAKLLTGARKASTFATAKTISSDITGGVILPVHVYPYHSSIFLAFWHLFYYYGFPCSR